MENYFVVLPKEYKIKKVIDANDKKIGIIFNILSLVIGLVVGLICYFIKKVDITRETDHLLFSMLVFCISLILTIVIHELLHGLGYKILTKRKLTFGMNLSVAFCGVPDIYVTKKTALISVLLPFVFFTIFYIAMISLLPSNIYAMFAIIVFSVHTGGCIGDLYVSYILIFKMNNKCLMNDTGPKQTFYDL